MDGRSEPDPNESERSEPHRSGPDPREFDDREFEPRGFDDGGPFGHLPEPGDLAEDTFVIPIPRVLPVTPPLSADQIPSRYRRSASASVLAASMLGLRDIIEPPDKDEVVIDQHADEGDGTRSIEVYLDPDDPAASLVVIRDPADLN